jgi:hypothetical protein
MPSVRFDNPFPMCLQRCANQAVQGYGPRVHARRHRIGEKADEPARIPNCPGGVPTQRRVLICQVFRQRPPERGLVEWHDRTTAENPGVAMGGFAARFTTVDEHDRATPLLRCTGHRHPDNARAQHDDIPHCCLLHGPKSPCTAVTLHQREPAIDRQQGSSDMPSFG